MSEKHEIDVEAKKGPDEPSTNDQNQSRRKFIKGAAAATPIILSVASKPVWARNCSLSGQLSGNLSDHDGIPCSGQGCSTDFWAQSINLNLYHPKFPPDLPFSMAFGRNAFSGSSLLQVIRRNVANNAIATKFGCTPDSECRKTLLELGAQAVAALQNSASPVKYDLDLDTVILSFQKSFDAGTLMHMQDTILAFQRYNNQYCPLPYNI
ncbi:MAG: hypothetical protein AMJ53_13315 [Gammaproteobacteria bacterium SG8_11]|nr:MAG: hypothetical protein AMJ53_13315 [Gammaproteobacteria bacterium SG8_11]